MKIKNNSKSTIAFSRGGTKIRVAPGINTVPDLDWIIVAIEKSQSLEYVVEAKITSIGTIETKPEVVVEEPKPEAVVVVEEPKPEAVVEELKPEVEAVVEKPKPKAKAKPKTKKK